MADNSESPKDDEAKFNETLKRMLDTKPKPQKSNEGHAPAERVPKRSEPAK